MSTLVKTDWDTLRDKNRIHMRQCVSDGVYYTERNSFFYSLCDGVNLGGHKVYVPIYTKCKPVRVVGDSVLVRHDVDGAHFFAWIHS